MESEFKYRKGIEQYHFSDEIFLWYESLLKRNSILVTYDEKTNLLISLLDTYCISNYTQKLQRRLMPIGKICGFICPLYAKTGNIPKIILLADTLYEIEEINRDILSIQNELKDNGIPVNRFHIFEINTIWSSHLSRTLLLSGIDKSHVKDIEPVMERKNSVNLTMRLLPGYRDVTVLSENDIKMYPFSADRTWDISFEYNGFRMYDWIYQSDKYIVSMQLLKYYDLYLLKPFVYLPNLLLDDTICLLKNIIENMNSIGPSNCINVNLDEYLNKITGKGTPSQIVLSEISQYLYQYLSTAIQRSFIKNNGFNKNDVVFQCLDKSIPDKSRLSLKEDNINTFPVFDKAYQEGLSVVKNQSQLLESHWLEDIEKCRTKYQNTFAYIKQTITSPFDIAFINYLITFGYLRQTYHYAGFHLVGLSSFTRTSKQAIGLELIRLDLYNLLLQEIEKRASRTYQTTEYLFQQYIKHPKCILSGDEKNVLQKIIQDFSENGIKFQDNECVIKEPDYYNIKDFREKIENKYRYVNNFLSIKNELRF